MTPGMANGLPIASTSHGKVENAAISTRLNAYCEQILLTHAPHRWRVPEISARLRKIQQRRG